MGDSFVFHHVIFLCYCYLMYIVNEKFDLFLSRKAPSPTTSPSFKSDIYTNTLGIKGVFRYSVITCQIIYFGERKGEREMPNEELLLNLKDMMSISRIKSMPKYQPLDTIQLN